MQICQQFFLPHMNKHISKFVSRCCICQQAKSTNVLPAGLLQPLSIPMQIWGDVAMDFITGLPLSNGFTFILLAVDRLSTFGHFLALKTDYTSSKVADTFMHNVVKLHGMPKSIVSDRDKVFTSHFWQHLFKLSGTTLAMNFAYLPQIDGQSEALNKCLELYLRCFAGSNPKSRTRFLSWAEDWYNTSFQSSIPMSPFNAVYGREPLTIIRYEPSGRVPPSLQQLLVERDTLLQ